MRAEADDAAYERKTVIYLKSHARLGIFEMEKAMEVGAGGSKGGRCPMVVLFSFIHDCDDHNTLVTEAKRGSNFKELPVIRPDSL